MLRRKNPGGSAILQGQKSRGVGFFQRENPGGSGFSGAKIQGIGFFQRENPGGLAFQGEKSREVCFFQGAKIGLDLIFSNWKIHGGLELRE